MARRKRFQSNGIQANRLATSASMPISPFGAPLPPPGDGGAEIDCDGIINDVVGRLIDVVSPAGRVYPPLGEEYPASVDEDCSRGSDDEL